jgi:transposase
MKYSKILNRLVCFAGYILYGISFESNTVVISLKKKRITGNCPRCERRCRVIESYTRKVRDLDAWGKTCYIKLETYHIKCKCGYYGIEKLDFLDKYSRYTKRFTEYVAMLCKRSTILAASETAKIDWKTTKDIDKRKLKELIKDLSKIDPQGIGVDEIACKKGRKYLTIVRDIEGGVIWIGDGRKKEVLDKFFQELGKKKCKQITVAVIDMWDPYIASIVENTNAEIVFDKFHVSKRINEVVDNIRKKEFAQADPEEKKLMKHKRFLILARRKNLELEKRETLDSLIKQNNTLYIAYLLKEQILDVFEEGDAISGIARLYKWFDNVRDAGMEQFSKVIETIKKYLYGILNYFKHQLTNAASEGINTKINVIKRMAYGFRDMEYFKLKILQSCG